MRQGFSLFLVHFLLHLNRGSPLFQESMLVKIAAKEAKYNQEALLAEFIELFLDESILVNASCWTRARSLPTERKISAGALVRQE